MNKVDILLSTYNGMTFLAEQWNSLVNQTFTQWRLIIRDDGSTDGTDAWIQQLEHEYPEKVLVVRDESRNLGPCRSFAVLMEHSTADHVMFCDQDDVWLPDKMERMVRQMNELEEQHPGQALLVHADLQVVDWELSTIDPSFWAYQKLNPHRHSLNHLLVQNNVTGCAMLVNRKAVELALPVPESAIMHDWWLALVVAAFGQIAVLDRPVLLYRQHGRNDVGAKRYSPGYFFTRVGKLGDSIESNRGIMRQGLAFLEQYESTLSPRQRKVVAAFARLFECGVWERLRLLARYRFCKYGWLRNAGYSFVLLTAKKRGMHK